MVSGYNGFHFVFCWLYNRAQWHKLASANFSCCKVKNCFSAQILEWKMPWLESWSYCQLLVLLLLLLLFFAFYSFWEGERYVCREGRIKKGKEKRERENLFLLVYCPQQLSLSQGWSWKLRTQTGSPVWGLGPNYLSHHLPGCRVWNSSKLEMEAHPGAESRHSDMKYGCLNY